MELATVAPMRHVIWDWNGTLFDDLHVVIDAVNATIGPLGAEQITADDYRTHYTRPVRVFYDRLLGRPLTEDEWHSMDDAFHGSYRTFMERAELNSEAVAAVERVRHSGGSQSLLSMYSHDELIPLVARYGLSHELMLVNGLSGEKGAQKADSMQRHLGALLAHPAAPSELSGYLVIGDALDDAAAARHNEVDCILFAGGSHAPEELASMGYPVAESLLHALDLAGI